MEKQRVQAEERKRKREEDEATRVEKKRHAAALQAKSLQRGINNKVMNGCDDKLKHVLFIQNDLPR